LFIVVQTTFPAWTNIGSHRNQSTFKHKRNFDERQSRQGEIILLQGIKSKQQFKGITDKNGKFSLLIPEGDNYIIIYKTLAAV
jgi:hypothetical protein